MESGSAHNAGGLNLHQGQPPLRCSTSPPTDPVGEVSTSPTRERSGGSGGYKSKRSQEWIAEVPGSRRMNSDEMEMDKSSCEPSRNSRSGLQRPGSGSQPQLARAQGQQARLQDRMHTQIDPRAHTSRGGARPQMTRNDAGRARLRENGGRDPGRRESGAGLGRDRFASDEVPGAAEQTSLRSDSLRGDNVQRPDLLRASSGPCPRFEQLSGQLGFAPTLD